MALGEPHAAGYSGIQPAVETLKLPEKHYRQFVLQTNPLKSNYL